VSDQRFSKLDHRDDPGGEQCHFGVLGDGIAVDAHQRYKNVVPANADD
jgi:hypothetical protein